MINYSKYQETVIVIGRKHNKQVYYHLLCPCVLDVYSCVIGVQKVASGSET